MQNTSEPLVMITGAAGALGQAVAHRFAQAGARLLLVDVSEGVLARSFAGKQPAPRCLALDLTDAALCARRLTPVLDEHGPADVLCNIAGGFTMGPAVHETPDAEWRRMFELNLATLINASHCAVPGMIRAGRGRVINIAAASAVTGKAQMGGYCAAKSSVARLTESMAMELREHGINVNAVAPSILDTPANRGAMPDADPARWVALEALCDVIAFLASPAASAVHGAIIPVVGLS